MTHDKAGRRSQRSDPRSCSHSRLVEYEYVEGNKRTGNLICRECATVFPDPRQTNNGEANVCFAVSAL